MIIVLIETLVEFSQFRKWYYLLVIIEIYNVLEILIYNRMRLILYYSTVGFMIIVHWKLLLIMFKLNKNSLN